MKHPSLEKFVVLPFSLGCNSHSSVAVASGDDLSKFNDQQKPRKQEQEGCWTKQRRKKNTKSFCAIPKHNISSGIHRLIKSVKSLSRFFVLKEEIESEEMEIGFPTDVKHVTHIGLDGTTTTNPLKNWEDFGGPPNNIISFPSISLHQFELAMAAQTHGQPLHQSKLD
ncbi:hypothetical protein SLA2020_500590 [Shorea laevis]